MGVHVLLASAQATENLSIFDAVSPPAASIRELSVLVFAITGFIFLVVEAVLLYCVFRFRRRAAPALASGGQSAIHQEPPQVYGSVPIEIAWTVAPAMIVFVLTLVTTRTLWDVERPPPEPKSGDNALFVTVTGRQWWWEYRYDHYDGEPLGFVTANELHIPAGDPGEGGTHRPVYLALESADVCHSFWVPRLAGKTDLIPGRVNHLWFQTDRPGLYLGQCAEYCGTQHAGMLLRVYVDTPEDFAAWLADQKGPAAADPDVAEGRRLFLSLSCVNCHRIEGTTAQGTYAPDLTHLMSRETIAAGLLPNTKDNLRRWIDDPQDVKPGCLMPAFALGDRELDLVVEYLSTLR